MVAFRRLLRLLQCCQVISIKVQPSWRVTAAAVGQQQTIRGSVNPLTASSERLSVQVFSPEAVHLTGSQRTPSPPAGCWPARSCSQLVLAGQAPSDRWAALLNSLDPSPYTYSPGLAVQRLQGLQGPGSGH